MKHNTIRALVGTAGLAAALAVMLPAREAQAQVRLSALGGVEHIGGNGQSTTMVMVRGEATLSLIPWLHGGVFVHSLSPTDPGKTGYGLGAIVALRPALPGTSVDPMGYASIGYQRAPVGAEFATGALVEVGAGLAFHLIPILDLDLRAGYAGILGSEGMNGFSVLAGLSLHP